MAQSGTHGRRCFGGQSLYRSVLTDTLANIHVRPLDVRSNPYVKLQRPSSEEGRLDRGHLDSVDVRLYRQTEQGSSRVRDELSCLS
jgi:hypothetical protein